jgi:hypothetical protein
MKLLACLLTFTALVLVSCDGESKTENTDTTKSTTSVEGVVPQQIPLTSIEFLESSYNFGTINEGDPAVHIFKFKNTGSNPLILSDARASCGCTVPSFTKDPIAPGEEGELKVSYDSKGKSGEVTKTVTVTANTEPKTTDVKITVNVLKKIDGPFNK